MDKNTLYPILSIVLVALVAVGIYYVAGMFGGTDVHHEDSAEGEHGEEETSGESHGTSGEAEALFYEAMLEPLEHDSYIYSYEETASNGYVTNIFVTASDGFSYVKKEDAIFTRELFTSGNTTILCLENVNRELCMEVNQNSSFNPYAYNLKAFLFNDEQIKTNEKNNKLLIQYGAIVFKPEVVSKSYEGHECKEIAYTLDYSKLTVEQMRVVGMSTQSPEVLLSKEYNYTLCIDPETKVVMHKSLTYLNFGEPASSQYISIQAVWGTHQPMDLPTELGDEPSVQEFYNALKQSQKNYARCLITKDFDICMRNEAILSGNERLCAIILNQTLKDGCYMNVALSKGEPLLCKHLSGEMYADCLTEFAWKYKDSTYCSQIPDSAKQQACVDAVLSSASPGEEEPTPPAEEPLPAGSECKTDADCVTAGCSSQLCVPKSLSDIITTCEYRPEYDCLPLSSCGCNDGTCGWDENQDYLNCLGEKANQ